MYIKSIVLDGFKSYGNRVEIKDFDPEFNAITGLNGTGKSNILDSICFVLGITNLSNVRAGTLQDLIYKHGQAGIVKATVSITFDNTNPAQRPIGYDSKEITVTRQVILGGKNRYLINGNNVQNKRVNDLFCSVQLNVNNPHFLIMQGRITKVLNMKPQEILAMVEEAAGTRMYEAKKQCAQRTIEKKDAKLRELNDIIEVDIAPKLRKLQEERSHFQEYQKVVRELENLNKLYTAWKYVTAEAKATEAGNKLQNLKDDIKANKNRVKESENEMKNIDKQIADMNKALEEETGSVLSELMGELCVVEKTEAGSMAAVNEGREKVEAHEKAARSLERALNDDGASLAAKQHQVSQVSATFEGVRAASEAASKALAEANQRLYAINSGQENVSESLQGQLAATQKELQEVKTRELSATTELGQATESLRTLRDKFRASAAAFERDRAAIAAHQAELDTLQAQLSTLGFDPERYAALRESTAALQHSVHATQAARDTLVSQLQRCFFQYTPPPGFNQACVKGTVCRLLEVEDPVYCTALDAAAGGKMYNVVVDTDATGKVLVRRGELRSRTTIIPLNKISATRISASVLRIAQEIAGDGASALLALELVKYAPELEPAMVWVFGGTLVCPETGVAKRVTFDPRVLRTSVTLEGDVFDPQGTVQGGANFKGKPLLAQLASLQELEKTLAASQATLSRDLETLHTQKKLFDDYNAIKRRYEQTSRNLECIRTKQTTTQHEQLQAKIEMLETKVRELTEAVERDKLLQQEAQVKVDALNAKCQDINAYKDREIKEAEEEVKKCKKAAEEHGKKWSGRQGDIDALQLEVEELQRAVEASAVQRDAEAGAALEARRALQDLQEDHRAHAEAVKEIRARIARQKEEVASRSTAVKKHLAKKEALAQGVREAVLAAEKLAVDVAEVQAEAERYEKEMSSLQNKHSWISSEREYFGAAGGLYDFESRNAATAGARLRSLTAHRDSLERGLNARAHTLLQQQEEQYNDLMRKKGIVEADRAKLVEVMAELDEKKRITLVAACGQVNRDFGSMFSTLLPGAEAKLQPPKGQGVLDGLEVRVGFNGAWKESLGELSGGQRSLVALSLVLAMLLFKPAPLYILDEVDAALDLSHTQNIGVMLRTHFKNSQFIIVSLKDGMFNNANVLFRTRFADGMSSVQRTVTTR